MIDKAKIEAIIADYIVGTDLFLVDIRGVESGEIDVVMDSDSRMNIEQCIALSRTIEAQFDREVEDFSLTVMSSGVGQPLTMLRQYQKIVGRDIEILYTNGLKQIALLKGASESTIDIEYQAKELVEGKKRKELVTHNDTVKLDDIKSASEYLTVK